MKAMLTCIHSQYGSELSTAAIAAKFSMKEGAVKVRLHRMRGQLREKLEQEGITL